ncbi:MAG: T9SS type A sorting domain-containing protein [Bacteroidia bacterium]
MRYVAFVLVPLLLLSQCDLSSYTLGKKPTKVTAPVSEKAKDFLYQKSPPSDHPEWGLLPWDAPCTNCVELIEYRQENQRVYMYPDDPTLSTYQVAYGYLHWQDEKGRYRILDHLLYPVEGSTYRSGSLPHPVTYTPTGLSWQSDPSQADITLGFGKLTRIGLLPAGASAPTWHTPNTQLHTVGPEGIEFPAFFTHTQAQIIAAWGDRVEIDYILQQPLPYAYVVFEEEITLPSGAQWVPEGNLNNQGLFEGSYHIEYQGLRLWTLHPLMLYKKDTRQRQAMQPHSQSQKDDAVPRDPLPIANHGYRLLPAEGRWLLQTWINLQSLQDPTLYPLVVDPIWTYNSPFYGSEMHFRYTVQGGTCWQPLGNFCGYNLNFIINPPAGNQGTIVANRFQSQYETRTANWPPCRWGWYYLNDVASKISGPCGVSPSDPNYYWFCNNNSPGTCTADGINPAYNIHSEVSACISPSCIYNLSFQMRNYSCGNCDVVSGCGGSRTQTGAAWHPANTWRHNIDIRSLETTPRLTHTGGTITGTSGANTSLTVNLPCNQTSILTLNPIISFGVPSYTYAWSTGANTPSITLSITTAGTYNYSVVVTDACGVSRTINYTINAANPGCTPAPIVSVEGSYYPSKGVLLRWYAVGENRDFWVERKKEGESDFTLLAQVPHQGNSYTYWDEKVAPDTRYFYRVRYAEGSTLGGKWIEIYTGDRSAFAWQVSLLSTEVPTLYLRWDHLSQPAQVGLYDLQGHQILDFSLTEIQGSREIRLPSLPKGIYVVRLVGQQVETRKLTLW